MVKTMATRPTLYGPKDPATRFQGVMSKEGRKLLEQVRQDCHRAAREVGRDIGRISDGDLVEWMARLLTGTVDAAAPK